jgi:small subunit ribosomal protein S16
LSRVGAKKQASYRIVVAESNAPRDGRAIAILGHYNPLTDPYTLKVDEERTVRWLKSGAQPSETARGLLAKVGVMTAFETVRKGPAQPKKAKGDAAEETKARRAARAPRTEAPRLVRPIQKEGAAEDGQAARATAAKKPVAGKAAGRGKAGSKATAKKAATARKTTTTASRATRAKAAAEKKS